MAAVVSFAGCVVAAYCIMPENASWLPGCPLHVVTGLHCPGCGTLRSLHQLVHGHLVAACLLNPLAVLAVPLVLYSLAVELSDRRLKPIFVSTRYSWVIFVLLLMFGAARNIPVPPLTLLAPH